MSRKDEVDIYVKAGGHVPVPEGYTVEQVLKVLRDVGHEPVVVEKEEKREVSNG